MQMFAQFLSPDAIELLAEAGHTPAQNLQLRTALVHN
jgi:hypothetical protein